MKPFQISSVILLTAILGVAPTHAWIGRHLLANPRSNYDKKRKAASPLAIEYSQMNNLSNNPLIRGEDSTSLEAVPNPALSNPLVQSIIPKTSSLQEEAAAETEDQQLLLILPKLINVAIQSAILAGNIIIHPNNNDNKNDHDDVDEDEEGREKDDTNSTKVKVWKQKANRRDLLTWMDPLCEKTIRETVLKSFPNHDFLGEEDVPPGKEASAAAINAKLSASDNNSTSSSKYLWIVDPIDGTTNFVHGSPLCGPSIAVAYMGEVIVGVIYDPHRKEVFYAVKGYGAYVGTVVVDGDDDVEEGGGGGGGRGGSYGSEENNIVIDKELVHIVANSNDEDGGDDGPRILCTTTTSTSSSRTHIINSRRISPPFSGEEENGEKEEEAAAASSSSHKSYRRGPSSLADSLVAMGSPPGEESLAMSLRALPVLMPKVRSIRMIGSAAIMLAWVADGRLSAYWEYDLSSWDVAAGSIIIEESGGRITNLENERWDLRTRKICATVCGGPMHDELLETLAEAGVV